MGKRNILIVCHYAQQPPYNTMLRYHNWGKELVQRGDTVTIIAASTIHNTDFDIVEKLGKTEDSCDGVLYRYIRTPKYRGNGMQRIKNMLAFCTGLRQFKALKPDIIIGCEAYLFPFIKFCFKNIPVITDTVDLWPESIIEYANYSKTNPIIKILYRLERNAYVNSDALVFSMEGGEEYLKEQSYSGKIDYRKVFHINMGCDIGTCDRYLKEHTEIPAWDFSKFNIVYCGSIRQANQVLQICEAAKELLTQGVNTVEFQIYGNGDELESLKRFVEENHVINVHFHGRFQKEMIPCLLSYARASLLTYKQVDLMKYGGSQSKLFDYLAGGRPIICNAKWGYNLIERYHCGIVTEAQTPGAFAKAIMNLLHLSEGEIEQMGKNGRKAAEMYDQPILVDTLCDVFSLVLDQKRG